MDNNKNSNREQKSSRSRRGDNFNKPKDGLKSSTTSAKTATSAHKEQPSMTPQGSNNNSSGKWSSGQSKFNRILGNLERTILNQFSSHSSQHNGNSLNNDYNNTINNNGANNKQQQQHRLNPSAPQAATTTNTAAAAVLANAAAQIAAQQQNKQQNTMKISNPNLHHHVSPSTASIESQHNKGIKLQQQSSPNSTKGDDGHANNKMKSKMTLNKYQQQIVSTLRLPNRHLNNNSDNNNNNTQQPIVAVGVGTKLSIPPPHANNEARSNRLLFGSTATTTSMGIITKHDTSNCFNNGNKLPSLDRLATNSSPASSARSLPTIGINQKVLLSDRSQNEEKNKCSTNNNIIDSEEESGFTTYQSRRSLGLTTGVSGNNNNKINITGVADIKQTDKPKQTMNNNMIIMQTSQVPMGSTINFNLTNHHQQPPPPPLGQQNISHHQHLQNLHQQQQQQQFISYNNYHQQQQQQQQQHFISYNNYLQQQQQQHQHHHEQNINTQLQNHNQILSTQVPIMSQRNSLTNSNNNSFYTPTTNHNDLYNNNLYGQQQQQLTATTSTAATASLTTLPPPLPLPAPPLPSNHQTSQVFNNHAHLLDNQHQQQIYANAPPKPRRYQYYEPSSNTNQLMIQQQQNVFLNRQRQQHFNNIVNRPPIPIQKPQPPLPAPVYNSSYLNHQHQHGRSSPDIVQNALYQQQQVKYFPPLIKSKSSLDASDLIALKQQQQDSYNVSMHSNQHHQQKQQQQQQRAPIYGSQIISENNCRYPSMTIRPSYSNHHNQNNQQFATAFSNLIAQQQAHNNRTNLQRSKSVTHLLTSNDYNNNNNNNVKENSNSHLIVDLTTPRVLAKTQTNLMAVHSSSSVSPAVSAAPAPPSGYLANRPSSWSINQLGLPQMNTTTSSNNIPNGLLKTSTKLSPSSASHADIQSSLSLTYDVNQVQKQQISDTHQRSAPYYYSDLKSKEQQMALLNIVQQKSLSPPPQLLSRSNDQSNTRLAPRSATMHANQARALSENLAAKQQQYNLLRQQHQSDLISTNSCQNKSNETSNISSSINKNIDKLFDDKFSYDNKQTQIVQSMLDLNDCKDSNEVVSCLASFPLPSNQRQHFLPKFYESIGANEDKIDLNDNNINHSKEQMSSLSKQAFFNKSKSLDNIAQKSSSSSLQVNDADLIVVNSYQGNNRSRNPVYENIKRSDKLINAINNSTTCLSNLTSRNNHKQQLRLNRSQTNLKTKQSLTNTSQARHGNSDESMDSILATSSSSTISLNDNNDDDEEEEDNRSSDDNDNSSSNSLNIIDEINISSSSDNHLGDIIKLIEQLKLNHSKLTEEYKSTLIKIANTINNNDRRSSHYDDKRKEMKIARRLELLELKSKKCESRSKNQLALIQMMEKVLKQQSKMKHQPLLHNEQNQQQEKESRTCENNDTIATLSPVVSNDNKVDNKQHLKPIMKVTLNESNDTKVDNMSKVVDSIGNNEVVPAAKTNITNGVVNKKVINFERKNKNNMNPFSSPTQDFDLSENNSQDDGKNGKKNCDQELELDEIKKRDKRSLLNIKDDEDFIEFLSTDNSSHRSSQFEASQFSVSDFNTSTSSNQSDTSAGCCNDSLNSPIISTKSPQQTRQQISSNNKSDNGTLTSPKGGSILKKGGKSSPISKYNNNDGLLETENQQKCSYKLSSRGDKENHSDSINNNNNDDFTGRQSADSLSVLNSNSSSHNSMTNRFNNVLGNVIDVDVCSLNNMSQCSPPVNRNHRHEARTILN